MTKPDLDRQTSELIQTAQLQHLDTAAGRRNHHVFSTGKRAIRPGHRQQTENRHIRGPDVRKCPVQGRLFRPSRRPARAAGGSVPGSGSRAGADAAIRAACRRRDPGRVCGAVLAGGGLSAGEGGQEGSSRGEEEARGGRDELGGDCDPRPNPRCDSDSRRPCALHPLRCAFHRPHPSHVPLRSALLSIGRLPRHLRTRVGQPGSGCRGWTDCASGRDSWRAAGRGSWRMAGRGAYSAGLGSGLAEVACHGRLWPVCRLMSGQLLVGRGVLRQAAWRSCVDHKGGVRAEVSTAASARRHLLSMGHTIAEDWRALRAESSITRGHSRSELIGDNWIEKMGS